MAEIVRCARCDVAMVRQDEALALSRAGDGHRERMVFRGILAEVFRCPLCRGIGTRPAKIAWSGPGTAVA
jgi:hypothetical protein